MCIKPVGLLLLVAVAGISFAHGAVSMVGSDFSGVIYDVDPNTGACSNPRSTGLSQLAGFTVTPDGLQAYALTSFGSTPPNALFHVNPATGATAFIGNTGLSLVGEGDLCLRPGDGTLFALWNVVGSTLHMFTLNPLTGAATDVGTVASSGDLSGLAFAPGGALYCFENGATLRELDPSTAATLKTINLTGISPATGAAGMAFAPDGTLYLACNGGLGGSLYTVDLDTGAMQRLGPTTSSDGYALASLTIVPEPGAVSLVLLGLALAARRLTRS